jgi:hypothetical protein
MIVCARGLGLTSPQGFNPGGLFIRWRGLGN